MLGLVASGPRNIRPGKQYEKYFQPATGKESYLSYAATNYDTLEYMATIVRDTLPQTKAIANLLKKADLNATCKAIFDFVYNHYQYKQDSQSREQLRSPLRAWKDRRAGVDCDCYSITVSSILTNLGISHAFKMTKYDGKSYFQHVYIVVPKNQKNFTEKDLQARDKYFVIDPVLNQYNHEKTPSEAHHKIFNLNSTMSGLNGLGNSDPLAEQLLGIDGNESLGLVSLLLAKKLAKARKKSAPARQVKRASRKAKRATRRAARKEARSVKRAARKEKRAVRKTARKEKRVLRKAIRKAPKSQKKALRAQKRQVRKTKRSAVKDLRKTARKSARSIRKTGRKEGRSIKRTGRSLAKQVKKGLLTKAAALKQVAAKKAAARKAIMTKSGTAKKAIASKGSTAKTKLVAAGKPKVSSAAIKAAAANNKAIAAQAKKNAVLSKQLTAIKKLNDQQSKLIAANKQATAKNTKELNKLLAAKRAAQAKKAAAAAKKKQQTGTRTFAPKQAKVTSLSVIRNIKVS